MPRRQPDIETLKKRVRELEEDKTRLESRLEEILRARFKLDSKRLVQSLYAALETMRSELRTPKEATHEYTISGLDVDLKTGIETDTDGNVLFRLPESVGTQGEALSTIRFSIKAIPKPRRRE